MSLLFSKVFSVKKKKAGVALFKWARSKQKGEILGKKGVKLGIGPLKTSI